MVEFFFVYRLILAAFTIYEVIVVLKDLIQYKKYFDTLPFFLRQFIIRHGVTILKEKVRVNYREIRTNFTLLIILIILNIILFYI